MKTHTTTDLAYWLSLFIGPLSGPFVFKAAGLQDFPSLQFSHVLIMFCYIFGALGLSQLALRYVLRMIKRGKTDADGTPSADTVPVREP
ncbi:MAG: hypothetical protein JWO94_1750 [Verrucomicrobiaceae bacterium]|nr:hypothetical protein [Verrucomicrobiaceae bacterium]